MTACYRWSPGPSPSRENLTRAYDGVRIEVLQETNELGHIVCYIRQGCEPNIIGPNKDHNVSDVARCGEGLRILANLYDVQKYLR